jgi:hypothetical protein
VHLAIDHHAEPRKRNKAALKNCRKSTFVLLNAPWFIALSSPELALHNPISISRDAKGGSD